MRDPLEAHLAEVEAWRRERYERLTRPISWLSLAGLHWLRRGENRVGSGAGNEVVLPGGPPLAGRLLLTDAGVVARGAGPAGLHHDAKPVDELALLPDADAGDDGPTMLELGRFRMCAIRRGDRFALRVWDTAAEALSTFAGIPHFPVERAWRIEARFVPAAAADTVEVPDVLGTSERQATPGRVTFERDGAQHVLDALAGGPDGELWLVFADLTNGQGTYGGGRYLYTDPPGADGLVVVDFNRAYNPPCVFTPYATCAVPWPANRLAIAVTAGEMALHG